MLSSATMPLIAANSEQGVVTYALIALRGVDVLIESSGQSASNEVIAAAAAMRRVIETGQTRVSLAL